MALQIYIDASYLSVPKGRSRTGGHIYLGNSSNSATPMLNNGAVLTISGILKHVMSSAAEAKVAGHLSMPNKKAKFYELPSTKLATRRNQHQSKPTIPRPVALPTAPSITNNAHAPSTCGPTGWAIASNKVISSCFWPQAKPISPIISPNTIH
jgi:hypothetical protein